MTTFVQLHILTSYPPSNLNRDDLGRPKTAIMGGTTRLRISSQSLKRAWRKSSVFGEAVGGAVGTRTREFGQMAFRRLTELKIPEKDAKAWAGQIVVAVQSAKPDKDDENGDAEGAPDGDADAGDAAKEVKKKGKLGKQKDPLQSDHLVHFGPDEWKSMMDLIETIGRRRSAPTEEELAGIMRTSPTAVDIAMFGRMVADNARINVQAAVQVAHAITVHSVTVEDDYFSAVDDLNKAGGGTGSGHIGETEFGSGVFYLYACVTRDDLVKSLGAELAARAMGGLVEAACRVSPSGKQGSFASRGHASFVLAERGEHQPRSLSVAFLRPLDNVDDPLTRACETLVETADRMDKAYEVPSPSRFVFDVHQGKGTIGELKRFVAG